MFKETSAGSLRSVPSPGVSRASRHKPDFHSPSTGGRSPPPWGLQQGLPKSPQALALALRRGLRLAHDT